MSNSFRSDTIGLKKKHFPLSVEPLKSQKGLGLFFEVGGRGWGLTFMVENNCSFTLNR